MQKVKDCDTQAVEMITQGGRGKHKIENRGQSCLESTQISMSKSTGFVDFFDCVVENASTGMERDWIVQECEIST